MRFANRRMLTWLVCVVVSGSCTGLGLAQNSQPAEIDGVVVDEKGDPVSGAEIYVLDAGYIRTERGNARFNYFDDLPEVSTRSGNRGEFRLRHSAEAERFGSSFYLAKDARSRFGLLFVRFSHAKGPLRIALNPMKSHKVRVIDANSRPIAGAQVRFHSHILAIAAGVTDALGYWSFSFPDQPINWSVGAQKSGAGFDYQQSGSGPRGTLPDEPIPDQMTLRLTGARPPLHIKTVDPNGKPLPEIGLLTRSADGTRPLPLTKPGLRYYLHSSSFKTGKDGTLVLDWLPRESWGDVTLLPIVSKDGLILDENLSSTDRQSNTFTYVLRPKQSFSGKVTLADGRPAPNALVSLLPLRTTPTVRNQNLRAETDANGRYELKVKPREPYLVLVRREQSAQLLRSLIFVAPGRLTENVDLVLEKNFETAGLVLDGPNDDAKPIPGSVWIWIEITDVPNEIRAHLPGLPEKSYILFDQADSPTGEFRFLLPPGPYVAAYNFAGMPGVRESWSFVTSARVRHEPILLKFRMPGKASENRDKAE